MQDICPETAENIISGHQFRTDNPRLCVKALFIALAAALITVCFFCPRFVLWQVLDIQEAAVYPEVNRARSTLQQIQDPWVKVEKPINRVITWRLLFPLIWHYTGLPRNLFLALPMVGCMLVLWFMAWLMQQKLRNWWLTFLSVILYTALPWFFVSSGWLTYFDSWLVLSLLVVAFIPSMWALGSACFLAPWVDERFLFALPLCLTIRIAAIGLLQGKQWRTLRWNHALAAAAFTPYVAIRAVAWFFNEDKIPSAYIQSSFQEAISVPMARYVEGLWSGYRAGWAMVLAAVVLWWRHVGWRWGTVLATLMTVSAIGGLFIAGDMSRTMMVLSPAIPLGIWLMHKRHAPSLRWVLPLMVMANLFLPARHIVWSYSLPVSNLYTEIQNYLHPPDFLQPAAITARGEQRINECKPDEALRDFNTAIRLDSNFIPAYLRRSYLYLISADMQSSIRDAETALRLSPNLPDALYLRAIIHQACGEKELAVDKVRHALTNATSDWSQREDAAQFLKELTGSKQP